mmetsp:Transcript_27231/g.66242  ORF Transcript_27231/g.66242 Transcript_27231/m.66242 type:complete len:201 (-) Transcript_27231:7-609(-)
MSLVAFLTTSSSESLHRTYGATICLTTSGSCSSPSRGFVTSPGRSTRTTFMLFFQRISTVRTFVEKLVAESAIRLFSASRYIASSSGLMRLPLNVHSGVSCCSAWIRRSSIGKRVQVPLPIGVQGKPTMNSSREDLPLDCSPTTTSLGRGTFLFSSGYRFCRSFSDRYALISSFGSISAIGRFVSSRSGSTPLPPLERPV